MINLTRLEKTLDIIYSEINGPNGWNSRVWAFLSAANAYEDCGENKAAELAALLWEQTLNEIGTCYQSR